MLQLIYGTAKTGKTYNCLQMIKADALKGNTAVFLVPEQLSFESENAVLELLGDKLAQNVEVISFTALAENLSKECGFSKEVLSDADKIVFMVRALKSLKDVLPIWKKYLSSVTFASRVVDMIGEFKVSSITPEQLDEIANRLRESALKTKLLSLSLVWKAYDAIIESRFIDPADTLEVLYRQLLNNDYFKNKNVYIDSFNGFTGQQNKIIEKILTDANKTVLTGVCDKLDSEEFNVFYNTRKTLQKALLLAKKHNVKIAEPIVLKENRYNSEEMHFVHNSFILENANTYENETENIVFCRADGRNNEAAFAALQIRRLVREKGLRYRDFAIIARNSEDYESVIENQFSKAEVPCFFDKKLPLTVSPVYRLISSAVKASKSFSSRDILNLLKTQLVEGFCEEDINKLENYVYLWNINGAQWNDVWNMDPNGFALADENSGSESVDELKIINELRFKAVNIVNTFKKQFCGGVSDMSAAIYNLLKNCKTDELINDFLKDLPSDISAEDKDVFRQSLEKINAVLEGIVKCFKNENIGIEGFINAFEISCATTFIGRIPQLIDQVTFSSADRICPSGFKYVFILGANQGVFPAIEQNNSLLNNNDRKKLISEGLEIRDKTIHRSLEENLLVYSCVCGASDGVCLVTNTSSEAESTSPSSFFEKLESLFKKAPKISYSLSNDNDFCLPETYSSAFELLCSLSERNNSFTASLKDVVLSKEQYNNKYKVAVKPIAERSEVLSCDTAKGLYTKNISASATRFDTYHHCHFMYFCRYGLKVLKVQPASLDVMQRGTLVHYVLEQFCNRHKEDIGSVSEETVIAETNEFTNKYFSLIKGSESLMTPRFVFLVKKIKDGIIDVILRMVKEFAQGQFKPECCELSIAPNGVIEPVTFDFGEGKLNLYGSIDRLDTYEGYVRIVDYKTGAKTFKMADTLYGQNMQMLLYLYAVIRGSNSNYNSKKPAGILYLPSKLDINREGLSMNGLLCDDVNVIKAMDSNMEGEFVPAFKINKDGTASKSNTSFISCEDFDTVFDYIEVLAKQMGKELLSGDISVNPLDTSTTDACKYCDYKAVCGIEDKPHNVTEKLNNNEVLRRMRGGE